MFYIAHYRQGELKALLKIKHAQQCLKAQKNSTKKDAATVGHERSKTREKRNN